MINQEKREELILKSKQTKSLKMIHQEKREELILKYLLKYVDKISLKVFKRKYAKSSVQSELDRVNELNNVIEKKQSRLGFALLTDEFFIEDITRKINITIDSNPNKNVCLFNGNIQECSGKCYDKIIVYPGAEENLNLDYDEDVEKEYDGLEDLINRHTFDIERRSNNDLTFDVEQISNNDLNSDEQELHNYYYQMHMRKDCNLPSFIENKTKNIISKCQEEIEIDKKVKTVFHYAILYVIREAIRFYRDNADNQGLKQYYNDPSIVFQQKALFEFLKNDHFIENFIGKICNQINENEDKEIKLYKLSDEQPYRERHENVLYLDPNYKNEIHGDSLDGHIQVHFKEILEEMKKKAASVGKKISGVQSNYEGLYDNLLNKSDIDNLTKEQITWKEWRDAIIAYIKTLFTTWNLTKAKEAFEYSPRGQKTQWQKFMKTSKLEENIKRSITKSSL